MPRWRTGIGGRCHLWGQEGVICGGRIVSPPRGTRSLGQREARPLLDESAPLVQPSQTWYSFDSGSLLRGPGSGESRSPICPGEVSPALPSTVPVTRPRRNFHRDSVGKPSLLVIVTDTTPGRKRKARGPQPFKDECRPREHPLPGPRGARRRPPLSESVGGGPGRVPYTRGLYPCGEPGPKTHTHSPHVSLEPGLPESLSGRSAL